MTEHEMLQAIMEKLDAVDKQLSSMGERITAIEESISDIRKDTMIIRSAVNSLTEWAGQVAAFTQVHIPVRKAE